MVNLITVMFGAAVGQLVRWGRAIVAVALIVARSMGSMIKRVGLALFSASALPLMRQQLPDSAVQLRRQSGEHILEVGPRVVPIELGRLQQIHHHCGALAGQFTADEQPIFSFMVR